MSTYHYFYKITNLLNGHFYYGVHNTNDLNDGYMGSGKRLHQAYTKYGIENFEKEILKYFDTMDEAFLYESEIVNETLVKDPTCYNIALGGKTFNNLDLVVVKNKDGHNYFWINCEEYFYNKSLYDTTWTNRHHTLQSKDSIRNKMTPSNSTNNRIWVNKDGKVKYLLKEKLLEYLDNGWALGRLGYKPRKGCSGVPLEKEKTEKPKIIKNNKNLEKIEQSLKLSKLREEIKEKRILIILNSNIDFTKFGWVGKVANLISMNPSKVNCFMKKYMPEFYEKCFIRKSNNIK